jgi:hypothetical protein
LDDKIKDDKMGRGLANVGEVRIDSEILFGKPEGKKPRWRPRYIWEDNIKIDPKV